MLKHDRVLKAFCYPRKFHYSRSLYQMNRRFVFLISACALGKKPTTSRVGAAAALVIMAGSTDKVNEGKGFVEAPLRSASVLVGMLCFPHRPARWSAAYEEVDYIRCAKRPSPSVFPEVGDRWPDVLQKVISVSH